MSEKHRVARPADGSKNHNNGNKFKKCKCVRRKWAKCPHPWHVTIRRGPLYRGSLNKLFGNRRIHFARSVRCRAAWRWNRRHVRSCQDSDAPLRTDRLARSAPLESAPVSVLSAVREATEHHPAVSAVRRVAGHHPAEWEEDQAPTRLFRLFGAPVPRCLQCCFAFPRLRSHSLHGSARLT